MPRICTICAHAQHAEIDVALVGGTALRSIAQQFGCSATALHRHKADHLTDTIKQSAKAQAALHAMDLVDELRWCRTRTYYIHDRTSSGKRPDYRTALVAVGEIRKQAELWAELRGELDRGTHIDIHQDPGWLALRELIFKALEPFPEARVAVAKALFEEAQRGRDVA